MGSVKVLVFHGSWRHPLGRAEWDQLLAHYNSFRMFSISIEVGDVYVETSSFVPESVQVLSVEHTE